METFREFVDRIESFENKEADFGNARFECNPSLALKVDKNNKFKNFYGDTVVFDLDDAIKAKLTATADLLYSVAPQCFCDRLVSNTLHVTLHDLDNSPDLNEIGKALFWNELKIIEKIGEIRKYKNKKIRLKSNYCFNMVNTSLVLGLRPVDERAYGTIAELYDAFDEIKKLKYPFTPHITLAYYNINGFDMRSAKVLEDAVRRVNQDEFEIDLSVDRLFYQKFTSMNDYVSILQFN